MRYISQINNWIIATSSIIAFLQRSHYWCATVCSTSFIRWIRFRPAFLSVPYLRCLSNAFHRGRWDVSCTELRIDLFFSPPPHLAHLSGYFSSYISSPCYLPMSNRTIIRIMSIVFPVLFTIVQQMLHKMRDTNSSFVSVVLSTQICHFVGVSRKQSAFVRLCFAYSTVFGWNFWPRSLCEHKKRAIQIWIKANC